MMMLQKITSRFGGITLYECEADSLLEALQKAVKARANLDGADLTRANLTGANLTRANLDGADLYGANLYGANLYGKEVLNIIQLAGIGSERRSTVAIILEDEIAIQCGCFTGSLDDFRLAIEKTHESNERYLTEYRAAIRWIESCATACRGERKQSKG